jgi:hypothetical protein
MYSYIQNHLTQLCWKKIKWVLLAGIPAHTGLNFKASDQAWFTAQVYLLTSSKIKSCLQLQR